MGYLTNKGFEGEMEGITFCGFHIFKIGGVTGDRNNDWGDRRSTGRGEREPRTGKSDADFTKGLLFGGLDPKEKT